MFRGESAQEYKTHQDENFDVKGKLFCLLKHLFTTFFESCIQAPILGVLAKTCYSDCVFWHKAPQAHLLSSFVWHI